MLELRNYQRAGIEDIRRSYLSGKRAPLWVLPTGGGKSLTFAWMVGNTTKRGRTTCIIVHRDHLVWQLAELLQDHMIPFGIIAAGFEPLNRPVQIASLATLVRRLDQWPHFDWLVVDEAHHAVAKTWLRVIRHFDKTSVLGVTATPARLDGKGLGQVFDDLLFGPSMSELIRQGYLANYRFFSPPTPADLSELHSRAGDFKVEEAAHVMDRAVITGDAVEHYAKHLNGAPSIAFCTTIAHAHHVAEAFRAKGYGSTVIEGATDTGERQRMLGDLARGHRLHVLASCEVISEGVDVPVCQGAILLRPTMSVAMYLQQVGRALRPKRDGSRAIILDHAGNSALHGFPAMDRTWTLADGVKRAKGKALVKECKYCFALNEPEATECEACGQSFRRAGDGDGAGKEMPAHIAGELVERAGVIVPEGLHIQTMPLKQAVKLAENLEQLQAIGEARGYKKGWAEHYHEAAEEARAKWGKRRDGADPWNSRPRPSAMTKPW